MLKNVFVIRLLYSNLYLYGDDLHIYMPYIEDIVDSVEDICIYCKQRNIHIYHWSNFKSLNGIIEFFRVLILLKRHKVKD